MNETHKLLQRPVMEDFPKVELHRHLEGTFPVEKLHQLSLKNNLERPRDFESFKKEVQFPKDSSPDFLTFLTKFRNDWYRSLDDVYFITYHSVKELVRDGLCYCELRFSPEHFALENDFDRVQVTKLIVQAGNEAAKDVGLEVGQWAALILATILLAGLCIWIIGWDADDEEEQDEGTEAQ